MSNDKQR